LRVFGESLIHRLDTIAVMILLTALIFGLHWAAGVLLLKRLGIFGQGLELAKPHWFAGYFIGLTINASLAFFLNQLLDLRLDPETWLILGFIVVLLAGLVPKKSGHAIQVSTSSPQSSSPKHSLMTQQVIINLVIFILVARHLTILGSPLTDGDSFLYHLPFGKMISLGDFPSDIGLSTNRQVEAAYPPLFFVIYGLNMLVTEPDITFLAPKITTFVLNTFTCVTIYMLARDRFRLHTLFAGCAALGAALILNPIPNIQSLTTLFWILALYYSWHWIDPIRSGTKRDRSIWPVAILWAGCCWSNYLGFVLCGFFLAAVIIGGLFVRSRRGNLYGVRTSGAIALLVAAIISPFLIRNWIVAGNPIYPAFVSITGGRGITPWILANHSIFARRPMGWGDLLAILKHPRLMLWLILAAFVSFIQFRKYRRRFRFVMICLFAGFIVTWALVLQFTRTPSARFLQPLAVLSVVTLCTLAQWKFRKSLMARISFFLAIVSLFLSAVMLHGPIGRALIVVGAVAISVPLLLQYFVNRQRPGFEQETEVNSDTSRPARRFIGVMRLNWIARLGIAALACICIFVARNNLNAYRLDIAPSLLWMNEHLPADAVILTGENRLFLLERSFLPADDHRLEEFYSTQNERTAMRLLREKFGVTHIYLGSQLDQLLLPFHNKAVLHPGSGNSFLEVVYEQDGRVIARIRRPAEPLPDHP